VYGVIAILYTAILSAVQAPVGPILNYSSGDFQVFASQGRHAASAFLYKNIFRYRHPVAINVKTGMPPFGILANRKIKIAIIQ